MFKKLKAWWRRWQMALLPKEPSPPPVQEELRPAREDARPTGDGCRRRHFHHSRGNRDGRGHY